MSTCWAIYSDAGGSPCYRLLSGFTGLRATTAWTWAPIAATWERDCARSRTGQITETVYKGPGHSLPQYHHITNW